MANVIIMPKLGYNQDTGSIAAWLKNEGDIVEKGEPLFDVQIYAFSAFPYLHIHHRKSKFS